MAKQLVKVLRTIDMVSTKSRFILRFVVDDNIVIELVKNQIKNCEKEN